MLDDKKLQAIDYLASGEYTKTEVAKLVGVSRTSLHKWLSKDEEFIAKLNERLQEIKDQCQKEFYYRLPIAIEEYWKLAMTTNDSRTKEAALSKWIERALGRVTNQLIVTAETKQNIIDDDMIEAELKQVEEVEQIEE
jgi:DNA-binding XRE family transcriptional regulator